MMRVAATTAVVAGTAGAVAAHSANKNAQQAQAPAPAAGPEVAPAATEPAEDTYAQLQKLGQLHEQGILTDEEFAAQKAKLLA